MSEFRSASPPRQARTLASLNPYVSSLGRKVEAGSVTSDLPTRSSRARVPGPTKDLQHWGIWTTPEGSTILCMLPDTGERYLSTDLFDGVPEVMSDEEREIAATTPNHRLETD